MLQSQVLYLCIFSLVFGACSNGGNGNGSNTDGRPSGSLTPQDPDPNGDDPNQCPSVNLPTKQVTPRVSLLLDRSKSMLEDWSAFEAKCGPDRIQGVRWKRVIDALAAPDKGLVNQLNDKAIFGLDTYQFSTKLGNTTCPALDSVESKASNAKAISDKLNGIVAIAPDENGDKPGNTIMGDTPTGDAIRVVADRLAKAQSSENPDAIILLTDGVPDQCSADGKSIQEHGNDAAKSYAVSQAREASKKGIRTYVVFVGGECKKDPGSIPTAHIQAMANAGIGESDSGKAKYWTEASTDGLIDALTTIVTAQASCDIPLKGKVNIDKKDQGKVTLEGEALTFETEWDISDDGTVLKLAGKACDTFKASKVANPIAVNFPCGAATVLAQ